MAGEVSAQEGGLPRGVCLGGGCLPNPSRGCLTNLSRGVSAHGGCLPSLSRGCLPGGVMYLLELL